MGFYVDEADRSARSGPVAEMVPVGTACTRVDGVVELLDGATNTRFDGVADAPRSAEYIAEEVDEASGFAYRPASMKDENDRGGADIADRAPLRGDEDGAVIRIKTVADNGTDPAPNITADNEVGVAAVGTTEFEGRLVQAGYTDDGGTQYGDGGAGDYVALGTADNDSSTEFDEPVRIRVGGHE